ncbi:MAG: hypothetical protein ACLQUY_20635 [Ktedonobacterales bacterium]
MDGQKASGCTQNGAQATDLEALDAFSGSTLWHRQFAGELGDGTIAAISPSGATGACKLLAGLTSLVPRA